MNKLISVIITTYKRPVEIVKRAVNSVVNQTYDHWELFVINDNPEDIDLSNDIKDMIDEFNDPRIHYYCMERNRGACAARNQGIRLSKGEYIALLDDDDEWMSEKLSLQLGGFNNERVGLVYSPFYKITDLDSKPQLIARATVSGNVFNKMIYGNIAGGCSMTMFSRKAINEVGLFDEALLSSQDYDLYLRISEKYEFVYIGVPLVNRYLQDESITNSLTKQIQGWDLFTRKHQDLYNEYPDAYSYRINRFVSKLLEKGSFKEAFKYYKMGIKMKITRHSIIEPLKGLGKFLGYRNNKDSRI